MCGVDGFIIGDEKYWQRLAVEIGKKTMPGGIVMGMGSDLYRYLEFRAIHEGSVKGADIVMEKFQKTFPEAEKQFPL